MMKTKNKKGFTLAELLIVVAIIGVLVAVSIPIFAGRLDAAREATCSANKRALYADMSTHYLVGDYDSLQGAFDNIYADKLDEYVCPSGGILYWEPNGETGRVKCTYHDDGQESADGETYPGTNIQVVESYWPTEEDFEGEYGNATVAPGGIFRYTDGSYYVVTKPLTMTRGQAESGPGGEVFNWFSTEKLTGRVISYTGNTQMSDLNRGDLCLYNGSYYVYNNGGSWSYGPDTNPGSWYQIPS